MGNQRAVRIGLGALMCASVALPASVQAAEGRRVIEEVVVTAEKRETDLQETAIAITSMDARELDMRGITGVEGLQFSAPNLVISHNSQSPVTYAYIRGIGSDQLVAGFDPGVAYNVDGIYVGQPSSLASDFWDLDRVEVLRGPQGTLYGRNSTGGSINVITRDPDGETDAKVDVSAGNYDYYRIRAAAGGALTDRVSFRLSGLREENDGFQDNLIGRNGDRTDDWSLRGKLAIDISDRTRLVLTAQRFQNDGNQSQKRREPFGPVEVAPGFVINVYDGAIPNPANPRKVAKDLDEKLDLTNTLLAAHLSSSFDLGALGPVEFRSITGWIRNEWYQRSDIDMSSNPVQRQDWNMHTEQFTQELQLVSAGESPWEWILGVFWFDEHLDTDYVFDDVSIAGFTFNNGGYLDTRSYAAYGQIGYDFRDSGTPLKLVGGLRWTRDQKALDEYQAIPQFAVDLAGSMDKQWQEVTGKLELDWFIADDVMGYGTYSHGYKGGGFSIGQFDSFDPETVDAFELGLKSRFMDGRAQLNLSAFHNDYKDLQVNFLQFTLFTTDNAARATIDGLELEAILLATDTLTLQVMGTWLDATFDEYQFTPTIDLSGQTLNRAPKFTYGLTAIQEWPLGNHGTLTARADYYWQDDVYYRVQNIARHRADDQFTADARLVWTSADEQWTLDAYVTNLTDEDNLRGLTVSDGLSTGNNSFVSYYPPRQYGVRIGWKLGQ